MKLPMTSIFKGYGKFNGWIGDITDIDGYNEMVKKRKEEREKKAKRNYIVKGFTFPAKDYEAVNKQFNDCMRKRNIPILKKQEKAMAFVNESGLTFEIKKRHFFTEGDIFKEMINIYEKHLNKHADSMPPKDV